MTLDTVNRIELSDSSIPYEAILVLLNSKLVSWFVHRFVYNRAIRTMHFDADYVGRLPFPRLGKRRLSEAIDVVDGIEGGGSLSLADDWIYNAFALTRNERALIEETTFHGMKR